MDRQLVRQISALGGAAGTGHKFGHGRVDPVEAGRKGGAIGKADWTPERRARQSKLIKAKLAQKRALFVEDKTPFGDGFDRPTRMQRLMRRIMK